jgi:hypothetical protein
VVHPELWEIMQSGEREFKYACKDIDLGIGVGMENRHDERKWDWGNNVLGRCYGYARTLMNPSS